MAATEYVLMNQDIPVLDFTCRRNEFDEPEFFEGTWHVDYRPIGYRGLAAFLEHRKAPKHREHIRQLLEQYGCDDLEGFLQVTRDSLNPHGKVHGGALAALADTVGGNCACARGRSCVTASQSMEFLRPAEGPYITCVATPKKEGHTLSVIQVELSNAEGKLVATGTFTFFMMDQW